MATSASRRLSGRDGVPLCSLDLTTATVLTVLVTGLLVRLQGLSTVGLYRDDAWVALAARAPFATALRMSTSTPGFTLIERAWISDSLWPARGQLLPLAAGVAAVPVLYFVAQGYGIHRRIAIIGSLVVALSPVCISFSTHIKQYSTDFLLACLLLWYADRVSRAPSSRSVLRLVALCVGSLALSGSTVVVVIGAWGATFLCTRSATGGARRCVSRGAVAMILIIGGVALLLASHISPTLYDFWSDQGAFLELTSPAAFASSAERAFLALLAGLFPLGSVDALGVLHWGTWPVRGVGAIVAFLLYQALRAGTRAWPPALVILVAVAASAGGRIPLGTGRTDEVVYPALLLLMMIGCQNATQRHWRQLASAARPQFRHALVVATVSAIVTLTVRTVMTERVAYPAVNITSIRTEITKSLRSGDQVLVDPAHRYPWALYDTREPQIIFGPRWGAGYTVASTAPNVFIAPSETWEIGFTPKKWVRQMASAERIFYVATNPRLDGAFILDALADAGWEPLPWLRSPGATVWLCTRGPTPA